MNRRRLLTVVAATWLAGCGSSSGDGPPTTAGDDAPTDGDVRTPFGGTATVEPPTSTPTPTPDPTSSPTPTPTPTPEPTPTQTPTSAEVRVGLGEWASVPVSDTRLEARVVRFDRVDAFPAGELRPEYRDDAPLEPPAGERWVDASVEYRNLGDDSTTVSADAWSLVDLRDERSPPDATAMDRVLDTLVDETVGTLEGIEGRLVFATAYPNDLAFLRSPVDAAGPPVRWIAP